MLLFIPSTTKQNIIIQNKRIVFIVLLFMDLFLDLIIHNIYIYDNFKNENSCYCAFPSCYGIGEVSDERKRKDMEKFMENIYFQ